MQWQVHNTKKKFSSKQLCRYQKLRFKKRSDMLVFAEKNPGALAAMFLAQVRERLHRGPPQSTKDLLQVDVGSWAQTGSGLKEIRDLKEVVTLSRILMELNTKSFSKAADLCAQRIKEIRFAKSTGQSWEKAEVISLLPTALPSTSPVPDGAMAL